ncbi:MAG: hypothetical protein WDW36_004737 [Sanguina aurantia]
MSKCPFAIESESQISKVLKQVGDLMSLSIDYVGNPNGKAPTCKHGPSECQGNIQQLCLAQYAASDRQLLDFVLCQNAQRDDIGSQALARSCAVAAAGITDEETLASLTDCWSSYQGGRVFCAGA